MKGLMKRFWRDESGQALAEYGLVLALVAVAVIGSIVIFRDKINEIWDALATKMGTVKVID